VHQSSSLTIAVICEVQEATDLYVMCAGELFSTIVEVDLALYVKKDFHGPHSSTANPCLQLHLVGLLAIKKLRKLLQEPLWAERVLVGEDYEVKIFFAEAVRPTPQATVSIHDRGS
jgi:hypothetical protein